MTLQLGDQKTSRIVYTASPTDGSNLCLLPLHEILVDKLTVLLGVAAGREGDNVVILFNGSSQRPIEFELPTLEPQPRAMNLLPFICKHAD